MLVIALSVHRPASDTHSPPLPTAHCADLTVQGFMDRCSQEMDEVNKNREAEGTRVMKGLYPLLYSTAFGYRHDARLIRKVVGDACPDASKHEVDVFGDKVGWGLGLGLGSGCRVDSINSTPRCLAACRLPSSSRSTRSCPRATRLTPW